MYDEKAFNANPTSSYPPCHSRMVWGPTSVTDSFIHWVIESSFHLNLQDIINPKPLELGTWTFGSMFTLHHVSHITCQVSGVRCQFSRVTCQMSHVIYFILLFFLLWTIWWRFLVEGLLLEDIKANQQACYNYRFRVVNIFSVTCVRKK